MTRAASTPLATVTLLSELIPDRFEYRQGATYVDSTVADLLEGGAGVCQDFVHLGLSLLRHHGIAARYVSGYLFATAADDGRSESVEVDTHAWLEALLPVPDGGEPGLGRRRPDEPRARRRGPRQDRPRPPLRRRARRSRASTAGSRTRRSRRA